MEEMPVSWLVGYLSATFIKPGVTKIVTENDRDAFIALARKVANLDYEKGVQKMFKYTVKFVDGHSETVYTDGDPMELCGAIDAVTIGRYGK